MSIWILHSLSGALFKDDESFDSDLIWRVYYLSKKVFQWSAMVIGGGGGQCLFVVAPTTEDWP